MTVGSAWAIGLAPGPLPRTCASTVHSQKLAGLVVRRPYPEAKAFVHRLWPEIGPTNGEPIPSWQSFRKIFQSVQIGRNL
jgi:hypothetical protein